MNVKGIVGKWLVENGYGGLYNADRECGCGWDVLLACGEDPSRCEPGYGCALSKRQDCERGPCILAEEPSNQKCWMEEDEE